MYEYDAKDLTDKEADSDYMNKKSAWENRQISVDTKQSRRQERS